MNMAARDRKSSEREEERRQLLKELSAEQGPDWAKQFKPGSFGCHELLDRTLLASGVVEEYVLTHPACAQNPEWYALADKAASALQDLYQRIGAAHLERDEAEAS
jgi:hypothetical protein